MTLQIEQLIESGSLPSVLLLTGSREVANLDTAKEFAKKIMGPKHISKLDHGNHPDLHVYQIEGKGALHPVASIHSLLEEIALASFEADVKIFIIDQAERMLASSSNALLKILEEPPLDSYIILISNDPEQMLPTILSRSRKICLENSLKKENEDFNENVSLMLDHAFNENYLLLLEEITALERKHFSENLNPSEHHSKLQKLFNTIFMTFRDYEIKNFNNTSYNIPKIAGLIQKAYLGIEHHIKLRSILLHLFLQI